MPASFRLPLTFVAGAMLVSAGLAQPVTLRLNLKPGAKYSLKSTNKMTSSGAGPMAAMGNMTQTMTMAVTVKSKSAKGTTVQMKVTDLKVDVPKDSPMAGQMTSAASQMKGMIVEQLVSALGKVLSTSTSGGNPASQRALNQFGGFRVGFLGVEFPSRAVSPGATWGTSVDFSEILGNAAPGMIQAGKNAKVPVKYTFKGVKTVGGKRVANIDYTMIGSMDMTVGGPAQPGRQGMAMNMNLDMRGAFVVELATGLPLSGSAKGAVKTSVAGMNIVQNMSTTFTVK